MWLRTRRSGVRITAGAPLSFRVPHSCVQWFSVSCSQELDFFDFLRKSATELKDESLYKDFVSLNASHQNFYNEIPPATFFPTTTARRFSTSRAWMIWPETPATRQIDSRYNHFCG